ncbi:MAG: chromate resistance protein ChrB domain-containing protein [Acidimicrobiales bacterium]
MKWVTRERPKTDRIACPWLIRRFIDPEAEFLFVGADQVLAVTEREEGHSFDAPGAHFTHSHRVDGERCTFETLMDHFKLGDDAALVRLAQIVHAADVSADLATDPAGAGLLAIGVGGLAVESDDHRLLERAAFVYDALYAWCQLDVSQ